MKNSVKISHQDSEPLCILACQGKHGVAKEKFEYWGPTDCWFNFLLFGGDKECPYGCLGYGSCVRVCPSGAIEMKEKIPVIDPKKCNGCGNCVKECPKGILKLLPNSQFVFFACSLLLNDKEENITLCDKACTGCGICIESCPYGAIRIADNLIQIDIERCNSCGICVHKCPQGVFIDRVKARPYAIISSKCTGCGECIKVCQFGAIEGTPNKRHIVQKNRCIGCGRCFEVCPDEAITMAGALGYAEAA
ncbi:MAG: 4Fe-4S binding protein [candidate division WOR-3 bacterium]